MTQNNQEPKLVITVNDVEHSLPSDTCIATLIEQLRLTGFLKSQSGFALARNSCVIPKEQWGTTRLSSNDQILIIMPTQGG